MTTLQFLTLFVCFSVFCNGGLCLRIIGGRPGKLPYQVSLRIRTEMKHFCGGTVVSPVFVLTAAHCLYITVKNSGTFPIKTSMLVAVVGQSKLRITSDSRYLGVDKFVAHQRYNPSTLEYDIALMKLKSKLPLDPASSINSIPLDTKGVTADEVCVVSGWGSTDPYSDTSSEELLLADVQIVNLRKCSSMYRKAAISIYPGMVCAASSTDNEDACKGDSGGPMVCNGKLVGIVSMGKGCADINYPGVYTDVAYYKNWITTTMREMGK